jgi:tetratricopeptide (TPR) repeat protein
MSAWLLLFSIVDITIVVGNEAAIAEGDTDEVTLPSKPHHTENDDATTSVPFDSSTIVTDAILQQYTLPFTTQYYPLRVVEVLQQYPSKLDSDIDYFDEDDINVDDEQNDELYQVVLASWYIDLGIAHRTVMEEDYMQHLHDTVTTTTTTARTKMQRDHVAHSMTDQDDSQLLQLQTHYAVTAFEAAIHIYETIISSYHDWLHLLPNDDSEDEFDRSRSRNSNSDTTASKATMQMAIRDMERLMADAMFALAETYTLRNKMTLALPHYTNAYKIYRQQLLQPQQQQQLNDDPMDHPDDGATTQIHYAHCLVHLGLELIPYIYGPPLDDVNLDNMDHTVVVKTLSEVMESSLSLTFDGEFWKKFYNSFRPPDDSSDQPPNADDVTYTIELVQSYLLTNVFNENLELTERYMIQYVRTEQVIAYFTDAVLVFRKLIRRESPLHNAVELSDDVLEHQQSLANVLQNLASFLYQTHPYYTSEYSKAMDYHEEAYELYTTQIIPKIVQREERIGAVEATIDMLIALTEMYFQSGQNDKSKQKMKLCRKFSLGPCVVVTKTFASVC